MSYSYVYPSNWNMLKFQLRDGDMLVHKGDVPLFVSKFAEAVGAGLVESDGFAPDEHTDINFSSILMSEPTEVEDSETGQRVLEVEPRFGDMWSQSWDGVEDFGTLYVEANDTNIRTTMKMMGQYMRRRLTAIWMSLGYSIKVLVWSHQADRLPSGAVDGLAKKYGVPVEILDFIPDFPWYRISIANGQTDSPDDGLEIRQMCHIMSANGKEVLPYYRRYFLNKFLVEKYGDSVWTNRYSEKFRKLVVSSPYDFLPEANEVIYDRSDNWRGCSTPASEREQFVLLRASKIICSSKWLYRDTELWLRENRPNDSVGLYYVPNGNVMFPYPENIEKFGKKTAVYMGINLSKVDMMVLNLLCSSHPDWQFMLYAKGATAIESIPENMFVHEPISQEDIFPVLCRCHAGLITLNPTPYTQGMLSDKLFSYVNARIPTVYSGVQEMNYADYKGKVAFSLSEIHSLDNLPQINDETYRTFERDWSQVAKEIDEIVSA